MEYLNGVMEFITFACKFGTRGGNIICPCNNCLCNIWMEIKIARKHILWKVQKITQIGEYGERTSSNEDTSVDHSGSYCVVHKILCDFDEMSRWFDAPSEGRERLNEAAKGFYISMGSRGKVYACCQIY